jgi:hypothetical protein
MVVDEDTEVGARPEKENMLLLSDREQRYLDSRIQDLEKAATRSRWIYGSALAVSLMLFSVAYNEYFSWYRKMADLLPSDYSPAGWGSQLRGLLMKEWVESLQFDLPYVGGRFGASDAGVVGGVLLLMISFWCFLAAKRENHIVYFLVKDGADFDFSEAARFYLQSQIVSTQLVSSGRSKAYGPDDLRWKSLSGDEEGNDKRKSSAGVRKISRIYVNVETKLMAAFSFIFIFMAPVLSLLFVLAIDLKTLSEPSPFRKSDSKASLSMSLDFKKEGRFCYVSGNNTNKDPLIKAVCDYCNEPKPVLNFLWVIPIYDVIDCRNKGLPIRLGLSLFLIFLVSIAMSRAYMFQRGTQKLIHAMVAWKAPIITARKAALRKAKESDVLSSADSAPP